mgnify:CR=1 FL=1
MSLYLGLLAIVIQSTFQINILLFYSFVNLPVAYIAVLFG